jgi:hypothetical protein
MSWHAQSGNVAALSTSVSDSRWCCGMLEIIAERRSVDIGTSWHRCERLCALHCVSHRVPWLCFFPFTQLASLHGAPSRSPRSVPFERDGELRPTTTSKLHRRRPVMAAAVLAPFAVHRALQPDHRRLQELD